MAGLFLPILLVAIEGSAALIDNFLECANHTLAEIRQLGLYKGEHRLVSPQGPRVMIRDDSGRERLMINLCANNYLGFANSPEIVAAAKASLDQDGYGMASVRFICGTQSGHAALERRIAAFLGMEDAILYASCFDANAGLFETLFDERDAIISDALNHASIIDGIRLCRARRLRYPNNDMEALGKALEEAGDARFKVIVTDGVFSMDGVIANLPRICDLAEAHNAIVVVDDSHAVGFIGALGRGTPELLGVMGRVDILTGTLGKALGGGLGGFTASRRGVIELLRQRSRPYLFSNALPPTVIAAAKAGLDLVASGGTARERLQSHAAFWRARLRAIGFTLLGNGHPIVPILIGEAEPTVNMARGLFERGVLVVPFSFPVVPRGEARIRVQLSAAHQTADLEAAIEAFTQVGHDLGIITTSKRGA
ncbi:MAG: glycine C-acetyltransferase [Rhodobacter sp.]|nr:glycine C-acetyltransferase [Cupriavidus sp.]MCA3513270.1 glycine C-acetyltransferase [Rhodobacter sp.]MCA3704377.1 glycine C-acetyltransferase [Methylobacterium sp.]